MEGDSSDIGAELPDIEYLKNVSELNIFIPQFPIFTRHNNDSILTLDTEFEPDPPTNRTTPSTWLDKRDATSFDSHESVVSTLETPDTPKSFSCDCKKYIQVERFARRSNGRVEEGNKVDNMDCIYYAMDVKAIELVDSHFGELNPREKQILFEYYSTQTYSSGNRMDISKPLCDSGTEKKVGAEKLMEVYGEMEGFVKRTFPEMEGMPEREFTVAHMYIPVKTRHNWDEMQELCSTIISHVYYHGSPFIHTRLTNILMEWVLGGIPLEEASRKYRIDIAEYHEVLGHSTLLLLAEPLCHKIIKSRNCEYFEGWGVLLVNETCIHSKQK